MHFASAMNIVFGSLLLVVLMFVDYIRKYNTDSYQRGLFLHILLFTFIAMAADFVYFLTAGLPGQLVHYTLNISVFSYYFFQVLAYFYVALFSDYIAFKNRKRTDRIKTAAWIFTALHFALLLLNFGRNYYFYISAGNVFYHGSMYIIRMVISFTPVLIALFDVAVLLKTSRTNTNTVSLILLFVVLTTTGSTLDILGKTNSLVWPCFVTAILYAYFFIVRCDSKIDSLTGLGNRYSFNEFIDKLSGTRREFRLPFRPRRRGGETDLRKKRKASEAYSIIMIDMDHFKEINDTLGHLEGDNALKDMSNIIKNCIRHSDFAARYGGDEFVLATRTEYDASGLLQRMQSAIDELNAKKERPYTLEISYGYDVYSADSNISVNDFLRHIDSLMYKHKNERRRKSDREQEQRGETGAGSIP
jgi:diguanylate cyclase (GGDEF)-like protein